MCKYFFIICRFHFVVLALLTQKRYLFDFELSSPECICVGSCLINMFATQAGLVHDVTHSDCPARKGSTCGCVLVTFKCEILTNRSRSHATGCCLFFIPLLLIVPVTLGWVPLSECSTELHSFQHFRHSKKKEDCFKTVVEHCVCVCVGVCVCVIQ